LLNISRVKSLNFDITEYDALESKENVLLVFHCSGDCFMIATGSDISIKYCSDMLFDSLSYVFSDTLYSHSFGNITFKIPGSHSHFFVKLNQSLDVISRE
jgi:hypothetical protein